jgi:DNA processing protein
VTRLEWIALACHCSSRPQFNVNIKEEGPDEVFSRLKDQDKEKALGQAKLLENSSAFSIHTQDDATYPKCLFELEDPPACLFVKGRIPDGDRVSIVGTRKASPLGLSLSRSFGCDLANAGLTVVSGLADGIDQASQLGALDAKGKTISVLGEGFDLLPIHKQKLVERIIVDGAVISEYPPNFPAQKWTFPLRNRIIAVLSKATIVIESPENSGSLITAKYAMEFGREVLATPGAPGVQSFAGCNKLIKDGAKLVDCVEDVLDVYGIKMHSEVQELNDVEHLILDYCDQPRLFDGIASHLNMPTEAVMGYLTVLNLRGLINKAPGGFYVRASFSNAKTGKNRSKNIS